MDFSTMRSKVDSHEYTSFKDFETDFWHIVNNSRTYNADGSLFYNLAVQLGEKVWESIELSWLHYLRTTFMDYCIFVAFLGLSVVSFLFVICL